MIKAYEPLGFLGFFRVSHTVTWLAGTDRQGGRMKHASDSLSCAYLPYGKSKKGKVLLSGFVTGHHRLGWLMELVPKQAAYA